MAPMTLVEIALSVPLAFWGAYTLTPFYHETIYPDAWSNLFFTWPFFVLVGVVYIVIGLVGILGAVWRKRGLNYYGMAGVFAAYAYHSLARLLYIGSHRPAYWIFYVALALIAAVCYIRERSDGE